VEYSHNQYGDVFADIYDDWYHDLDNIADVVEFVLQLADSGAVLELGVGTGRLAIPIAQAGTTHGVQVVGIDSSQAMLDELRAKPDGALVETHLGHMVRDMPLGPFGVVLIAYNTLFNLLTEHEQRECLQRSAHCLTPGGHIIVDCFVPNETLPDQLTDATHRNTPTGEILSRWQVDRDAQVISGVFTQVSSDAPTISRPYSVRYATVAQVDAMADEAGLVVEQRWSSYAHDVFDDSSVRQITVYGIAPSASS
jgi:SAM-dependent methyltransferase